MRGGQIPGGGGGSGGRALGGAGGGGGGGGRAAVAAGGVAGPRGGPGAGVRRDERWLRGVGGDEPEPHWHPARGAAGFLPAPAPLLRHGGRLHRLRLPLLAAPRRLRPPRRPLALRRRRRLTPLSYAHAPVNLPC